MNTPTPNPLTQPTNQPITPKTPQESSKLALWSLILGVTSIILAIFVYISIPAAIAAGILGAVVLTKHLPGKGKAAAGIITGGVALFLIIPIISLATQSLNNASPGGLRGAITPTTTEPSAAATKVTTDCYSYAIPTGYEYEEASKDCHTAVNYPKGDALTRIQVKGTTGTVGTLDEVVAMYNTTLKKSDPNAAGVIDKEQFTVDGKTIYYVSYTDGLKLLTGVYIVKDPESTQVVGGQPIVAYSVLGYTYNAELKKVVRSVVDSLVTK